MHIVQLRSTPGKGVPPNLQEALFVSKKQGIEGDCHSKGDRQISLWSHADALAAAGMQPQGLCMRRFSANVLVSGLNSAALRPGSKLLLGDVEVELTQVGKGCYPESCPLPGMGVRCPLQSCLYGRFLTDGVLRRDDPVAVLP